MKQCIQCLNSRRMVSENGYHSVCRLPHKQALDCFMGNHEQFIDIMDNASEEAEED